MTLGQQNDDLWQYEEFDDEDLMDEHGFTTDDYEALAYSLDNKMPRKYKSSKPKITRQCLDSYIEKRRWEKQYKDLFGEN